MACDSDSGEKMQSILIGEIFRVAVGESSARYKTTGCNKLCVSINKLQNRARTDPVIP